MSWGVQTSGVIAVCRHFWRVFACSFSVFYPEGGGIRLCRNIDYITTRLHDLIAVHILGLCFKKFG